MKDKILDLIKKNIEGDINKSDWADVENLMYEIENAGFINYSVCFREGEDCWLQAEYYSTKIKKTIIMDYNFEFEFDTREEFVDYILQINKDVVELEAKLPQL